MSHFFDVILNQRGLGFSLLLTLIALWACYRMDFFLFPSYFYSATLKLKQVLTIFIIYILFSLFMAPLLVIGVTKFILKENIVRYSKLTLQWQATLQGGVFFLIFLAFLGYLYILPQATRNLIFSGGRALQGIKERANLFLRGALTWFLAYPCVLFVSALTAALSKYMWGKSGVQQVAVEQLKQYQEFPFLFLWMSFVIACIVPFIEELLFRGFLQTYLRQKIGRIFALFITAFLFAIVHFSPSQGLGNFELIPALFVLACFLGMLYEKFQSLWASIGLHATFNGLTILFIYLNIEDKKDLTNLLTGFLFNLFSH